MDFNDALNASFTVNYDTKNIVTKPLKEWLSKAVNPRADKIKLSSGKSIGAMSLENFKNVTGGVPMHTYIGDNKKDIERAINGALFYYATLKMGDKIKQSANSKLGSIGDQEGIVVRDNTISANPVKITGSFITGKETGKFAKKGENEEYGIRGQLNNVDRVNKSFNYQTDPPYSKAILQGRLTPGMPI